MNKTTHTEVIQNGVRLRLNIGGDFVAFSAYFPEEAGEPAWAGCCDLIIPQAAHLEQAMQWYAERNSIDHLAYLVCNIQHNAVKTGSAKTEQLNLMLHCCTILRDFLTSDTYRFNLETAAA